MNLRYNWHSRTLGTIDSGTHTAALCTKCRKVATPAHLLERHHKGAIAVYCPTCCPCFEYELILPASPISL